MVALIYFCYCNLFNTMFKWPWILSYKMWQFYNSYKTVTFYKNLWSLTHGVEKVTVGNIKYAIASNNVPPSSTKSMIYTNREEMW